MGLLKKLIEKLIGLFTEEVEPQVILIPSLGFWINQEMRTLKSSEQEKSETYKSFSLLIEELQDLHNKREQVRSSVNTTEGRLQSLAMQKDEKETELLRTKDSDDYRNVSHILDNEKDMQKKCEDLDDSLFLFLVRLKSSLTELQDFNSNYEMLDVIKTVTSIQEDFASFFNENYYPALLTQIRWVQELLTSGTLLEREGIEHSFQKLFNQLISGDISMQREERIELNASLSNLARQRLQHDIFTKVEDLQYRIDHFSKQEETLFKYKEKVDFDLKDLNNALVKKKELFEQFTRIKLRKAIVLNVSC
jgi:hypothetical protein